MDFLSRLLTAGVILARQSLFDRKSIILNYYFSPVKKEMIIVNKCTGAFKKMLLFYYKLIDVATKNIFLKIVEFSLIISIYLVSEISIVCNV